MLQFAGILAGCFCILGHVFPAWMGFQGGKGLACIGGLILAHSWKIFLALLSFEIILTLSVNYICIMPMTASILFAVIYAWTTREWIGTSVLSLVAMVIQLKHVENVKRILKGTEFHVSYLWSKDAEIARVVAIACDERVHELV